MEVLYVLVQNSIWQRKQETRPFFKEFRKKVENFIPLYFYRDHCNVLKTEVEQDINYLLIDGEEKILELCKRDFWWQWMIKTSSVCKYSS